MKTSKTFLLNTLNFASMEKLTKVMGWLGVLIGLVTAIAAPLPGYGTPIAFVCMLPGFLCSSIYVLLSTRYRIAPARINPGYVGMLLNSAPLILLIYFKFIK